ncbi:tRNA(Ser) Um(44) 2'-O-methyltransferase [Onygenales sp. PD_12]|nr:tRNA(Ser) Um(44) 2'-O-methyltransferase [Onygenales sp. PD_12]
MSSANHPAGNPSNPSPDMAFAATLEPSFLSSNSQTWITSPELAHDGEDFAIEAFLGVTTHLLANPNINSSRVFRADILYDSSGLLESPDDEENGTPQTTRSDVTDPNTLPGAAFPGFRLTRTVVRRFIPRKQIDHPMEQTCHFYEDSANTKISGVVKPAGKQRQRCLVVYTPHVLSEGDLPYYHPAIRGLALLYDLSGSPESDKKRSGVLSIHFSLFSSGLPESIPYRLQRTLLSLLSTQLRLSRKPYAATGPPKTEATARKDNIIPQRVFQDTYTRLKETYAPTLMNNWVEDTEPSKHVFEDIAIAAFLIELWKQMYGLPASAEETEINKSKEDLRPFPGFVDIACGNGVLVYILHAEGYHGWGFDARRRKTWSVFPTSTQERLRQTICIPKPFMDVLEQELPTQADTEFHPGIFDKDTFIISNHADELTLWTPLLAALSSPESPLPFLAIPCCSHSISGARHRYSTSKLSGTNKKIENNKSTSHQKITTTSSTSPSSSHPSGNSPTNLKNAPSQSPGPEPEHEHEGDPNPDPNPQPSTGSLLALRALKVAERTNPDHPGSAYAALTATVIAVAEQVGYEDDVEKTLLRIPSTRNVGIVGGRRGGKKGEEGLEGLEGKVGRVVERECSRDGGVEVAAGLWVERAVGLQRSLGRGRWKGGGGSHGH